MASTSASLVQRSFIYDVFLSFRGEDTRKGFVDHLYHALDLRGIRTYKDDERIKKGERIDEQLIRSIEDSRFHIIVFSKNYASSSWCLEELVKIMECQRTTEQQTAYPIFYDVEPTQVRNQTGAVGEAFERSKGKKNRQLEDVNLEKEDDVGRWRDALKEAADLAGWDLNTVANGYEAKFIDKIIEEISPKLHFFNLSVDENLVGMDTRVENVVSSLKTASEDVCMIGIKGMGGAGKTTLAKAVFDHISFRFDGKSFVENIRESSKGFGLKQLQKQVLQDVLGDKKIDVNNVHDGKNMMKKMMSGRKVLLVLDDVDHIDQLKALAGLPNWFKPGSKIIITTRDKQVLVAHGVHSDNIHDVNLLSSEEAICLFSRHAFKKEVPIQEYEELSRKVVCYAGGLPLTITVLGSFLCGRIKSEWVDAIERLKTIPEDETLKRLELSYNGLENDHKEIFLDVACILRNKTKDDAVRILESCGFNAQIGLSVLEQKSLISISHNLCLHDLIVEMGWNIVRRLHPDEPSRHSRLWITEEIEDILVNESGTEATRSINLEDTNLNAKTIMKGLRNMRELKYLSVLNGCGEREDEVSQCFLPNALRLLHWDSYPFRFLPITFRANNLVNLDMFGSHISQLWEGEAIKVLGKLRFLNLGYSNLETLDLGLTPNLETLDLQPCENFVELKIAAKCPNLKILNLSGCSKLSNLDLGLIPNLENLNLAGCENCVELHMLAECPNLKILNLSGCSKLSNLDLGLTPNLENLNLAGCENCVELHMLAECPNLKILNLSGCSKLSNLDLGLTPNLENLNLARCENCVELHMLAECPKLEILNLSGYSKLSNLDLGLTPHLKMLFLEECYHLQEIHAPMGCLKELVCLRLSGCLRFKCFEVSKQYELPGLDCSATLQLFAESVDICSLHPASNLPKFQFKCLYGEPLPSSSGNLEKLLSFGLCACTNLESFSSSICGLQGLEKLTLEGSIPQVLTDLYLLESLEELSLSMKEIMHLPDSICMLKHLKSLKLNSCFLLEQLPKDLGRLEALEELHLMDCISLRDIPKNIYLKLKCLNFSGSMVSNLNLGLTPHLERLDHAGCNDFVELHIPIECPELKSLVLSGSKVSNLNLGLTPHLERLDLAECNDFVELHMPIECPELKSLVLNGSKVSNLNLGLTPHLERLDLAECNDFVELHIPIECPELKSLDLSGSKVSNLNLGLTPHLERLDLKDCYYLQEIHAPMGCLKELVYLRLSGCLRFKCFEVSKLYELPGLDCFATLQLFAESVDICPLHPNSNLPKFRFKCFYDEPLPSSSGNLEKLLSFGLCACTNLESFSASICGLQGLRKLTLEGSIPQVPKDLYQLESLEELSLQIKEIRHLPDSICMLKHLKSLKLNSCFLLEQLPKDLGRLEALEELHLMDCISLRDIPKNIYLKLKCLNFSGSMVSNLNLGLTPHLERLDLKDCYYLQEIDAPMGCPKELVYLRLSGCLRFKCFEVSKQYELPGLDCLATLQLFAESVDICPLHPNSNLPKFRFKCFYDEPLPSSSGNLEKLLSFGLCACTNLESFSASICGLQGLRKLTLEGSIPQVPKDLYQLESLEELSLQIKEIRHLPDSICMLKHLKSLKINSCFLLEQLPKDLGRLEALEELHLMDFISLRDIPKNIFLKLKCLKLSGSMVSNLNLGLTPHLERLDLAGCNDFVELHIPIECPELKSLVLSGSKISNLNLGLTPHLEKLDLKDCYYLQEIHAPMGCLKELVYLRLSGCLRFKSFEVSKQFKFPPDLDCLATLQLSANSVGICPLHPGNNLPKFQFKCFYDEFSSSGNLERLLSFGLCACTNLESFSASVCGLQHLGKLTIEGSIGQVLTDLYLLESLEELRLSMKEIMHLPDSICMLKRLKSLKLKSCFLLEQLPTDLGRLEALEELRLTDCISLRDIPNSICNMKCLKSLDLSYCILVKKLPEEFGRLKSLKEINIECAGISRLPQSIFKLRGLHIVGSRWRLESYGFTSLRKISAHTTLCCI